MKVNTLGGALWIDFLNTHRYKDGTLVDVMEDQSLFKEFLVDHQVEGIAEISDEQINKLKELREILVSIVDSYSNNDDSALNKGIQILNETLSGIPVVLSVSRELMSSLQASNHTDRLRIMIIESFLKTCQSYGLERVRQCAHESCVLFFLDTSKGGKRRWCDMGTCGNRAKASKHYHNKVKNEL